MKRMIVTAATILAASTPAFTQNTEQENNAAMAAVTYMIAQKRCNLTTGEDGKLRVTANSEDREPWLQLGKSGLRREADDRYLPERQSRLREGYQK
jgi:hypothetical protein